MLRSAGNSASENRPLPAVDTADSPDPAMLKVLRWIWPGELPLDVLFEQRCDTESSGTNCGQSVPWIWWLTDPRIPLVALLTPLTVSDDGTKHMDGMELYSDYTTILSIKVSVYVPNSKRHTPMTLLITDFSISPCRKRELSKGSTGKSSPWRHPERTAKVKRSTPG
ncbi:hypothetical protein BJ508DRAFT_307754 [Ascobolus immersus RN42]|uniref:Uncharacterized protein n=1 Tax=Ascobolus immersus RN42 TaxID=1160509 RepID=A0A3N4I5S6_ASCIM|nr:hypothetical protein BJ508DRAFT_307754 [Ascobolus immersus RN42]